MSSPTDAARRAVARARLARVMSWAAAMLGIGFVIAFVIQAGLFSALLPQERPPVPDVDPGRISAEGSTLTGIDRQNQPYEVTARRGWQDEATPTLVHLEGPEGRFRRAGGAEYSVRAATGRYDTRAKTLDLEGDVLLAQQDRFTARMAKASIVVEEKKLTSESPVAVQFTSGTVNANGLQITDDGSRILFLNGVKARFEAPQAKGDTAP